MCIMMEWHHLLPNLTASFFYERFVSLSLEATMMKQVHRLDVLMRCELMYMSANAM